MPEPRTLKSPALFILIGLLIATSLLRYFFDHSVSSITLPLTSDYDLYIELSGLLRNGIEDFRLLFVSPLYPYILSWLPKANDIFIIQQFTGVLSALLIFLLGNRLYQNATIANLATGLYCLCGPLLIYEYQVYPTSLSIFFLLLAIWLFREKQLPYLILSGSALAVALILNPTIIFIPIFLVLLMLGRRQPLKYILVFLLPLVIALSWSTQRNYRLDNSFIPLGANSGVTLSHGNQSGAQGRFLALPKSDGSKTNQHEFARSLMIENITAYTDEQKPNWATVDRYWRNKAMHWLLESPINTINLLRQKIILFTIDDAVGLDVNFLILREKISLLRLLPVSCSLLFILAFFGLAYRGHTKTNWPHLITLTFFSIFLVNMIFFVSDRYRLPAIVLLLLPAATTVVQATKQRKQKPLLAILMIISSLVVMMIFQLRQPNTETKQLASFNIAKQYEKRQDYQKAYETYEKLGDAEKSVVIAEALAHSLIMLNRQEEAKSHIREMLEHHPRSEKLNNNMGVLLLREKNLVEAKKYFEVASQLPGTSELPYLNLANIAYLNKDDVAEQNYLNEAILKKPSSWKAHQRLAENYYRQNKFENAKNYALRALDLAGVLDESYSMRTKSLLKAIDAKVQKN